MTARNAPADPSLSSLTWVSSKCRDGSIVVDTKYAMRGNQVFKRRLGPFNEYVFFRAPIKALAGLTYWTDVPESTWEQCNAYGFPLFKGSDP